MPKLMDDNPYEILGIPVRADKKTLTKAFMQKNRGNNQDRQLARQAFDTLRKSEERFLADALTPVFSVDNQDEVRIADEISKQVVEQVDWLNFLDASQIQKQDLLALTEATVKHFFAKIPDPQDTLVLESDYDGLQEFAAEWLK